MAGLLRGGRAEMRHDRDARVFAGASADLHAPLKELHFFGSDPTFRFTPRISESEYRALFSGAGARERIGESSVRYLQSTHAAEEIARVSPQASILAMLRNPVDMMHAMHSGFSLVAWSTSPISLKHLPPSLRVGPGGAFPPAQTCPRCRSIVSQFGTRGT